jgi:UDP-N-acetylmuramoyl-L-alanyl-D-glutamate--2,6-diaminopimelate ligase
LACYSVFSELKLDQKIFQETISHFPETKGRREEVENSFRIRTIIDFAHTPNALAVTLSSLRRTTEGKLIVIFGATGGRDKSKRPIMGKNVSELSDIAIVTADDTRNEKVEDINQEIISGFNPKSVLLDPINPVISKASVFHYANIANRQDAFNFAIKIAKAGDTVIACGKGHETSILHGNTEYPWSEAEAFRTAFRLKTQNV